MKKLSKKEQARRRKQSRGPTKNSFAGERLRPQEAKRLEKLPGEPASQAKPKLKTLVPIPLVQDHENTIRAVNNFVQGARHTRQILHQQIQGHLTGRCPWSDQDLKRMSEEAIDKPAKPKPLDIWSVGL